MTDKTSQAQALAPGEPAFGRRVRKVLIAVLKWAMLAVVLFFVGRVLIDLLGKINWRVLRFNWFWLAGAVACVLAAKGVAFYSYMLLLKSFGHRPPWRGMIGSAWLAQLGKYLPGKVASAVGMTVLLRRYGIAGQSIISSIFINDGMSVVLGLAASLPLLFLEKIYQVLPFAWIGCVLLMLVGIVCLHPGVFIRIGNILLRLFGFQQIERFPRVRDYFGPFVAMLFMYALLGLGYWMLVRAMTVVSPLMLPIICCAVVAANIAGFVALFAPAGLGVQEGVLMIVLLPLLGNGHTAILLVFMRLVQLVVEVGLAGGGALLVRSVNPQTRDSGEQALQSVSG